MSAKPCCIKNSTIVGSNSRYGPLHRCDTCRNYWIRQSNRFWEEVLDEGENLNAYSVVYYGPGELGLANAVLQGCELLSNALDKAQP